MRKTIVQILGGIIGIALIVLLVQLTLASRLVTGEPVAQAVPTDPVVESLRARYAELGVPVKEVRLVERFPLNVEITLRSAGEDDKTTTDDMWWFFLARREADLIYLRTGEHLSSYTVNTINAQGESIAGIESFLYPHDFDQQLTPAGPAAIGDEETRDLILEEWNIGKNEWLSLQVETGHYARENTKYVYMEWITGTDSFEESKARVQALSGIPPGGINNVDDFNARYGAQIAIVRVKIFDLQGNLMAHFIYDAERHHQAVRMAEGIDPEWMPRPAEPREAAEEPIPTPTSLPIEPSLTPAPYP